MHDERSERKTAWNLNLFQNKMYVATQKAENGFTNLKRFRTKRY